jgi:hypothetical protein
LPPAQAIDVAQNTPPGATGPSNNQIKHADHNDSACAPQNFSITQCDALCKLAGIGR